MNINLNQLAGRLYTTYCAAVGGVAFNGDVLPSWGEFSKDPAKEKQKCAWLEAASEANAFFCALLCSVDPNTKVSEVAGIATPADIEAELKTPLMQEVAATVDVIKQVVQSGDPELCRELAETIGWNFS